MAQFPAGALEVFHVGHLCEFLHLQRLMVPPEDRRHVPGGVRPCTPWPCHLALCHPSQPGGQLGPQCLLHPLHLMCVLQTKCKSFMAFLRNWCESKKCG